MKIYIEDVRGFSPWSGAIDTFNKIEEAGKFDALENFLDEIYPDGLSFTQLNDILRFEPEWIFKALGIEEEEEEEGGDDERE